MIWLSIASACSLIGIGALVWFATHVDPLSGRIGGRYRPGPDTSRAPRCRPARPTVQIRREPQRAGR